MDFFKDDVAKDSEVTNKKMSNIKNITENKRGQLIDKRKNLAKK